MIRPASFMLLPVIAVASASLISKHFSRQSPDPPDNPKPPMCSAIDCPTVECTPPFELQGPEATGMCCPMCWAEKITVPEDRSWAADLTGGVGPNNNADMTLCR